MAKISTYGSPTPPLVTDYLLGTDVADNYSTKNFKISDVFSLTARGSFYNTSNQSATTINTATIITFDTTALLNSVSLVTSGGLASRITSERQNTYSLSVSPQFYKATAGDVNVDVWIRINGSNVVGSNRTLVVKGGAVYTITNLEYFLSLVVNGYVEVCWSTPDLGVVLTTSASTGVRPSGYSCSALISQI